MAGHSVGDRVKLELALKFLSDVLCFVFVATAVPQDHEAPAMSAPEANVEGAPHCHHHGKESTKRRCLNLHNFKVVNEKHSNRQTAGNTKPDVQIIHPFEIHGHLFAILVSDGFYRGEQGEH